MNYRLGFLIVPCDEMHRIVCCLLIPLAACSGPAVYVDRWVWYETLREADEHWWDTSDLNPVCGAVPHPRKPAEFSGYSPQLLDTGELAVLSLFGYDSSGLCRWGHGLHHAQPVQTLGSWFPEPNGVQASFHGGDSEFWILRVHEWKLQYSPSPRASGSVVVGPPAPDGLRLVERIVTDVESERWCLRSYDNGTTVLLREPETADCSANAATASMQQLREGRAIEDVEWPRPVNVAFTFAHVLRVQADARELDIYIFGWSGPPRQVLHMRQTEGRIVATTADSVVEVDYWASRNRYRVETVRIPQEPTETDEEFSRRVLLVNRRGGRVVEYDEQGNQTAEFRYGFVR